MPEMELVFISCAGGEVETKQLFQELLNFMFLPRSVPHLSIIKKHNLDLGKWYSSHGVISADAILRGL